MFTGITEETGRISGVSRKSGVTLFSIETKEVHKDLKIGDSVSVNGICLTAVNKDRKGFSVEAADNTLAVTTAKDLKVGDVVNLERAMRLSDRLGGHLVTGHVDSIAMIKKTAMRESTASFFITIPKGMSQLIVEKGSICIDGISLTVARIIGGCFVIELIPHTLKNTTFSSKKQGDRVNIETDIIGKYVASNSRGDDSRIKKLINPRLSSLMDIDGGSVYCN